MKAAVIAAGGVVIENVTQPQAGQAGIVVRVHAAGLNRAEALSMHHGQNSYHGGSVTGSDRLPAVIGGEFAGEVVEVGAEVRGITVGDRVMGLGFGAHAEFALADAGCVYQIPEDMDYMHAASLPLALLTAYNSVLLAGKLGEGEAVLIHGASSVVGLMALQVARFMGASMVIGTSTTHSRRSRLLDYGAHLTVDSSTPTWPSEVLAATCERGVDLVIDHVAGPGFNHTMEAACLGGRIVNMGRLGGIRGSFDFDLHALKRLEYIGVTFRTRTLQDYRVISSGVKTVLWPAVVSRQLSLPIDRAFSLDEAPEAYRYVEGHDRFGKVLLAPVF